MVMEWCWWLGLRQGWRFSLDRWDRVLVLVAGLMVGLVYSVVPCFTAQTNLAIAACLSYRTLSTRNKQR